MVTKEILINAYTLMCKARAMAVIYDENRPITKYVHSTSKGHEAIQLAAGFLLKSIDYAAPYYRDESLLLAMGMTPYELMLQLLAKADDPFSGGRSYYAHPSLKRDNMPKMPHQSSATGMQAIPATGMAHGIKYKESQKMIHSADLPIVLCSIGDGSMTEGEVSEALQMAVLKELPILYLVQDNDWGISASGDEMRAMDAYEFAAGFKGLRRARTDGSDFVNSYEDVKSAVDWVRKNRKPMLLHAKVPLLGHHTSGVRSEWYRDDLEQDVLDDPFPKLKNTLLELGESAELLEKINQDAIAEIADSFQRAVEAPEPAPETVYLHEFAPTPVTEEQGTRAPEGREPVVMVDAALFACDE